MTTEELKLPWPSFAPLRFWRHWRDTVRAGVNAGLPLQTGRAHRAEFWSSLRASRVETTATAREKPPVTLPSPSAGRPLRVLLITHNLNLEGAPLLFAEYAAHLAQQPGAQITVLAGRDGPLRDTFARAGIEVLVTEADPAAADSPAELDRRLRRLAERLPWDRIDLVVANTLLAFWGVPLARQARRRSLLYIHESNRPAVFFTRAVPALVPAVHAALRHATAVSFNTAATRDYYAGLGSGNNFHLNPAWIDVAALDAFRTAHPRADLRSRLGLRDDELLVVNLGTVCERKGQHDFLRAVEWLARLAPDLTARGRFAMVGGRDTPYDREVLDNLAVLNRPNVQVVTETPRPFEWLAAADLFVCTSYEESFPRVVLEAMALGVPIVSTGVHGIPHMLRAGPEAQLVSPGNIFALGDAMRMLLGDPSRAKTQAELARRRVAEFDAAVLLPRHAAFTAAVTALPL